MASQVLKDLTLVDMSLDILFEVPVSSLTRIGGVLKLAFSLIGKIVDVILAEIVPLEAFECHTTIALSSRVVHVRPAVLVTEQSSEFVPHKVVVVLVGLHMFRSIVTLRLFEVGCTGDQLVREGSVVCFRIICFSWYVNFFSDDVSEGNLHGSKSFRQVIFNNLYNTGPVSAGLDIWSIRFTVVLLVVASALYLRTFATVAWFTVKARLVRCL